MNLYIDLIEEGEKRHGGLIPLVFVVKSIGVAIPLVILLFIAHLLITLSLNQTQLKHTEELISAKTPQITHSAEIEKQKKTYGDMLAQLNGWKNMRVNWNHHLAILQETVPLEVQLTDLQLTRTLKFTNNTPVATYSIAIRGKTGGGTPEANLTRFRLNMQKETGPTNYIDEVNVPEGAFIEDTSPGAHPMDRLFELNCRYQPRAFR